MACQCAAAAHPDPGALRNAQIQHERPISGGAQGEGDEKNERVSMGRGLLLTTAYLEGRPPPQTLSDSARSVAESARRVRGGFARRAEAL